MKLEAQLNVPSRQRPGTRPRKQNSQCSNSAVRQPRLSFPLANIGKSLVMSGIALDWQFELEVDWPGKQLDLHLEKTTETGISRTFRA